MFKPLPEEHEPVPGLPLERVKAFIDFTKHIATLTTAALLLTTAFADRLLLNVPGRAYLVVPLSLAAASLVTCLFAHLRAIHLVDRPRVERTALNGFANWLIIATILFYLSVVVLAGVVILSFPT
jgi:hypothetical protein